MYEMNTLVRQNDTLRKGQVARGKESRPMGLDYGGLWPWNEMLNHCQC